MDISSITKEPFATYSIRKYFQFVYTIELVIYPLIISFTLCDFIPSTEYTMLMYMQGLHIFNWLFILTVSEGISSKLFLIIFAILQFVNMILDAISMIWRLTIMLAVNNISTTILVFGWVIFSLGASKYYISYISK